jgi:hypothetical protein
MATSTKTATKTVAPDSTRKRSPRYPIVAIDEALNRVRLIYDQDRRAFATLGAILEHMGYKAREQRGGRSARMVATLRQYGLLDERDGNYRVSDSAFRIIELPEDAPERTQLIRQAALSPPIVKKVLSYYEGQLPSDTTLRSRLILSEEFNPDSADEFVRVLRRTITLVNPDAGDYNAGDSSEGDEKVATGGAPHMQQSEIKNPHVGPQAVVFGAPGSGRSGSFEGARPATELAFKLSKGSEARIVIYGDATQEAISKLRALLEISLDTFPTQEELDTLNKYAEGEIKLEP